VLRKKGIAKKYDSVKPVTVWGYRPPAAQTVKLVITKNKIEAVNENRIVFLTLTLFLRSIPIKTIKRKLP
jgi:hypothetical protein